MRAPRAAAAARLGADEGMVHGAVVVDIGRRASQDGPLTSSRKFVIEDAEKKSMNFDRDGELDDLCFLAFI